jgi:hypothetical protein
VRSQQRSKPAGVETSCLSSFMRPPSREGRAPSNQLRLSTNLDFRHTEPQRPAGGHARPVAEPRDVAAPTGAKTVRPTLSAHAEEFAELALASSAKPIRFPDHALLRRARW